jgi:hypothetical protein
MGSFISHDETLDRAREDAAPQFNNEGLRLAQSNFLDELPGAAFAVITLVWVVLSFAHLIWR